MMIRFTQGVKGGKLSEMVLPRYIESVASNSKPQGLKPCLKFGFCGTAGSRALPKNQCLKPTSNHTITKFLSFRLGHNRQTAMSCAVDCSHDEYHIILRNLQHCTGRTGRLDVLPIGAT